MPYGRPPIGIVSGSVGDGHWIVRTGRQDGKGKLRFTRRRSQLSISEDGHGQQVHCALQQHAWMYTARVGHSSHMAFDSAAWRVVKRANYLEYQFNDSAAEHRVNQYAV